ncbi:MAG: HNH endonuclease [Verrucomicrobiales bacterium]
MHRPAFSAHLKATSLYGSNKGTSYLRALDLLENMLESDSAGFEDCRDIWQVTNVERLYALQKQVREQQLAGDESVWNLKAIPKSYLQNGYCSAALTSYIEFLVEYRHTSEIMDAFERHEGSEDDVVKKLNRDFKIPPEVLEDYSSQEGKDVERKVKARVNQDAFRKIILKIYRGRCCLTGLDIPQVNRASHIVGWAEDKSIRMDPRNGLCLSATYDAAFDRHLITLDDGFRLVLSKDLKESYSGESFREHFQKKEGDRIELPKAFRPKQDYLEVHRSQGQF